MGSSKNRTKCVTKNRKLLGNVHVGTTSINGPPFPMSNRSKTRYFSVGEYQTPHPKKGGHCGYHGFWPSIPTQKAHTDQSPQEAQVSLHEHESGPRLEIRLVGYPITTKASRDYCQSTPSSTRLPSLRRWLANDFPANPLQLKNIYILPQTSYLIALKMIKRSLRRKTRTT